MKTTKLFWIVLTIIVIPFSKVNAQHVQLGYNYMQGFYYNQTFDLFKGGSEFSADYIIQKNILDINIGADFRTIQWGNQLDLSLGVTKQLSDILEIKLETQQGLALFYQKKLYSMSIGGDFSYWFYKKNNFSAGISTGIRFSACPAYKNYSLIYYIFEIPVGISIRL